jgi:hypothetical protein
VDIYTRIGEEIPKGVLLAKLEKLGILWQSGDAATRYNPCSEYLVLQSCGTLTQSSGIRGCSAVLNQDFLLLAEQIRASKRATIGLDSGAALAMKSDGSLELLYKQHYAGQFIPPGIQMQLKPVTRVSSKVSRRRDVLRRLSID